MVRRFAAFIVVASIAVSVMPACSSTANVSDVYTSLDEDGSRKRTTFSTDSADIFCIAQYGVGRADVTIDVLVKRTTDDGTITVVGNGDFHPEITKDKPGLFPFKIPRFSLDQTGKLQEDDEAPFDAGLYRCDVSLDGAPPKSVNFTVTIPPCPTSQIIAGSRCEGFYADATQCPQNGLQGSNDPQCTCTKTGWDCGK